ncbi:MAG: hypothetical protein ACTTIC_00810 [Helicobacteraceae bacterium]
MKTAEIFSGAGLKILRTYAKREKVLCKQVGISYGARSSTQI